MFFGSSRTSTAMGDTIQESILFVMKSTIVLKIKDQFEEEYQEMKKFALKREKHHKLLVNRLLKKYIDLLEDRANSADSEVSSDIVSVNSIQTERLEQEFQDINHDLG